MHLREIPGHSAALALLTGIVAISAATAAALSLRAPEPQPLDLVKRTNHVTLHGLTLRGSRPLALIVPVQVAASQFANLYTDLYLEAASKLYNDLLDSHSFTFHHNDVFEISFVTSNVETQAVPWEFVRAFAVMMRDMALRGFTGCYDQGYWNEARDFGVYVGLRVLAPLGLTQRL